MLYLQSPFAGGALQGEVPPTSPAKRKKMARFVE